MPNLSDYENPTEEQEAQALHQWLTLKNLPHWHTANESRSGRYGAIRGAKLKAMGQSAGVPDYFVVIPNNKTFKQRFVGVEYYGTEFEKQTDYVLVAIELKRKKGGVVSDAQKQWIETLNNTGIETAVCKGFDEAIKFIEERSRK